MINQLVKSAKKGNKDAFEKLISYYQQDLYKIARTRLNNIEDICDAVQETILYAYKFIHKLHNISKFKFWLIKILINKCNDIYSKYTKYNTISYEVLDDEKYLNENLKLDSNLEFINLLNILDNDEKTIIVLYYADKYKINEISKILNINTNTIKSKLNRARKKIEKDLEEVSYE